MLFASLLEPIASIAGDVLKRVLPAEKISEEDRMKIEKEFNLALLNAEDKQLQTRMSAILAEAKSADKWTSRARPSFLYVMYFMVLFSVPYGVMYIFAPAAALDLTEGMQAWLRAVPDMLWGVFGAGYLGYAASRSYDKKNLLGVKKEYEKGAW